MEEEMVNGAIDIISDMDYSFSEVVGVDIIIPKSKIIDRLDDYQNQGLDKKTKIN